MTSIPLVRTAAGIRVGNRPALPEHTALLEARGALLYWDELASSRLPAADITDPSVAADWLWEIYGAGTAAEILAAVEGIGALEVSAQAVSDPEPLATAPSTRSSTLLPLDAAHRLAHLAWAESWWPSSTTAGVPPLSRALLRAEAAVLTEACDHLLDDEDAVVRALSAANDGYAALRALSADEVLGPRAQELLARLLEVAELFGIDAVDAERSGDEPSTPARTEEFALAAGGSDPLSLFGSRDVGVVVQRGTVALNWYDFPTGTIDAAAEAFWTIGRHEDTTVLTVSAASAPPVTFPLPEDRDPVPLIARFIAGEQDVSFRLFPAESGGYVGETAVHVSTLLVAPEQRTLRILCSDFARDHPSSAVTEPGVSRALITGAGYDAPIGTDGTASRSAKRAELTAEALRRVSLDPVSVGTDATTPRSVAELAAARLQETGRA